MTHCLNEKTRGREIVELLRPTPDDYFVLKPKQSAFFSTTLEILLKHLGTETLILAGWAGDICVLFSASDAHLRDYRLFIPQDCVVSQDPTENQRALEFMQRVLDADIAPSTRVDLKAVQRSNPGQVKC